MYDHTKQYRCTIIRGKSQQDMEDLLPAYAKLISDVCPIKKSMFKEKFNSGLSPYIPHPSEKTLDNHRTEIAGKLFGMYYTKREADGETVYPSERTLKFLEDTDQPAFFKDICYKMQFPNGMTKIEEVEERITNGISIRSNCYLLKVLSLAEKSSMRLTKNEAGYYVLNALDVLTRRATPEEVIAQIKKDRESKTVREIKTPGKETSYDHQHIREQLNYLELANLIIQRGEEILLNKKEQETVRIFADKWNEPPAFDVASYDLSSIESRKIFYEEWEEYFAKLSEYSPKFETKVEALGIPEEDIRSYSDGTTSSIEIGDDGEAYVFEYEKKRVKEYDARLANKVIHLGKTKGLGYDIQSVVAEDGEQAEFVKYIEVKATKRVTEPNINDDRWLDTLNVTRNEWVAAQQHKDSYSVFRVYFVRDKVIMYVLESFYAKAEERKMKVTPMMYRIDFGRDAVDKIIPHKRRDEAHV